MIRLCLIDAGRDLARLAERLAEAGELRLSEIVDSAAAEVLNAGLQAHSAELYAACADDIEELEQRRAA